VEGCGLTASIAAGGLGAPWYISCSKWPYKTVLGKAAEWVSRC